MEKVRPWCGQPSDRGRLKNRNRTGTNSYFALAPISKLVRPALVTGFKQPLQINDFATFDMLPFVPLHFLCTHFWQLVHCNELLPTPLLQTPQLDSVYCTSTTVFYFILNGCFYSFLAHTVYMCVLVCCRQRLHADCDSESRRVT